ncbi:MAG TPA: SRPBCC family protein [Candidatus Limnocylindrales bacterium]
MARTSSRQLIGAPVDRLFDLAVLPERLPEWDPLVVTVSGVDSGAGGGPTFDAVLRIAGRDVEARLVVAHVERGRRIRVDGAGRDGGRFSWTRRFEVAGTFGAIVETDFEYDLPARHFGEPETYRRGLENAICQAVENLARLVRAQAVPVATGAEASRHRR